MQLGVPVFVTDIFEFGSIFKADIKCKKGLYRRHNKDDFHFIRSASASALEQGDTVLYDFDRNI